MWTVIGGYVDITKSCVLAGNISKCLSDEEMKKKKCAAIVSNFILRKMLTNEQSPLAANH